MKSQSDILPKYLTVKNKQHTSLEKFVFLNFERDEFREALWTTDKKGRVIFNLHENETVYTLESNKKNSGGKQLSLYRNYRMFQFRRLISITLYNVRDIKKVRQSKSYFPSRNRNNSDGAPSWISSYGLTPAIYVIAKGGKVGNELQKRRENSEKKIPKYNQEYRKTHKHNYLI